MVALPVKGLHGRLSMAIEGPTRYSTTDWIDCLRTLPTSRILQRTKWNIFWWGLWSTFVTVAFKLTKLKLQIPAAVHSVLGPALSLLLVFRTNSSYDRFWEGRKALSGIIAASRSMAAHAYIHLPKDKHRRLAVLLFAFSILQKQHIQGIIADDELASLFEPDELSFIQSRRNRPLYVIRLLESFVHDSLREKYAHEIATGNPLAAMPKYIEKHFMVCLCVCSVSFITLPPPLP